MTNASCADCGRIVAFRTHDPSEIAECRNCGTWVKRSAEMPGVAVSVKDSGPVARKTALPPRRDQSPESPPNPNLNTQRSATKRTSDRPAEAKNGETLSPSEVYAAIRDLQKAVFDLRAGQREILAEQKKLQTGQTDCFNAHRGLHDGQKALHAGQKQLFEQYQELHHGQSILLERTLEVSEMPVSRQGASIAASSIPVGPVSTFEQGIPDEGGFHTTPFSSLKIPLIPLKLEDLDIDPQFTETGTVPTIPASNRSNRVELIENPLPEPPPYTPPPEVVAEPPVAAEAPPAVTPFQEVPFSDAAYTSQTPPAEGASGTEELPDPFLSTASHESPFSIEGAPDDPFTIAEDDDGALTDLSGSSDSSDPAAGHDSPFTIEEPPADPFSIAEVDGDGKSSNATAPAEPETPFASGPQPFGNQEFSHEPCDMEDPFAEALTDPEGQTSEQEQGQEEQASVFSEAPAGEVLPDEAIDEEKEKSLSQQIADAKEEQDSGAKGPDPSRKDLLTEPKNSPFGCIGVGLLGLLLLGAAYLFYFTDIFKKNEPTPKAPPLIEFPAVGIPLSDDDEQIGEAEEAAKAFLNAKTQSEVQGLILPVDGEILKNFWEPMTSPTIERTLQGRVLENDRVEVDFIIKDYGLDERLLPLVKLGEEPFKVDWQSYAECEEVTLLGLAQGTLILDSGEEIDQGTIRSWLQGGEGMADDTDLGNFEAFRLHNFTEQVVALAVVRKETAAHQRLVNALRGTELRHKGKPAIRTILEVKRIVKEDTEYKKPARLEIIKVVSTNWSGQPEDELIPEKLPEMPAEESQGAAEAATTEPAATEPNTGAAEPNSEAAEEEPKEEVIEIEPAPAPAERELPPVPDKNDPLAVVDGETPLLRISLD